MLINPEECVGKAWPQGLYIPRHYRNTDEIVPDACKELREKFFIKNLSTSEGVYLRWCIQHCLRVYELQAQEIEEGKLPRKAQIEPIKEAVLIWLDDLYVEGLYASDIAVSYITGNYTGERGARHRDLCELVNLRRARANER